RDAIRSATVVEALRLLADRIHAVDRGGAAGREAGAGRR
ncbi:competence protein, partial [Micromonospora deserti]